MQAELTLNYARTESREADAWFIPGQDSQGWLDEILSWNTHEESLRLLIIPTVDRHPGGVIVTGVTNQIRPMRAQPYVRCGGRLLVPNESRLDPHVTETELTDLLGSDSIGTFVWHPTIGLLGFEQTDSLTLADLLTVPDASAAEWLPGNPGVRINDRLLSVTPSQQLTVASIIEQAGDDIGTEKNLEDAPRSPNESSTAGLRDAVRSMKVPFAKMAKKFTDNASRTADHRTWVDRMSDWADRVLNQSGSWSKRENELHRLLDMLRKNPDEGLRYAIPFGSDQSHRGIAPPSDQLSRNIVDYGASSSSGAADYWDMSWEMQQQLRKQYTELAEREVALGRHRRAAYIYANLLGDWHSAAAVLETGGHFREAAVIYQDRLTNKRKAAQCFERAGQFDVAIGLYEELHDWEAVAAIHTLLGDDAKAHAAWLEAVEACEQRNEYAKAAKLYEKELADIDGAIACLQRGWTHSNRPRKCLVALFDLAGRTDRSAVASGQIQSLVDDGPSWERRDAMAATTLSSVAIGFPNDTVRTQAADATRRLAARNLQAGNVSAPFTEALQTLHPDDRLLIRDCNRFGRTRPKKKQTKPREFLVQEARIRLAPEVDWQQTAYDGKYIYAAGFDADGIRLARWNPKYHSSSPEFLSWYVPEGLDAPLLMAASRGRNRSLMLHLASFEFEKDFARKNGDFGKSIRNAPVEHALGMTVAPDNRVLVTTPSGPGFILESLGPDGIPSSTVATIEPYELTINRIPVAAHGTGYAFVACGRSLQIFQSMVKLSSMPLSGEAHSISVSPNATALVAVGMADGGVVLTPKTEPRSFGFGLSDPVTCFTPQDDLIVADNSGIIEVYRWNGSGIDLQNTMTPYSKPAVGVEYIGSGRVAFCYADGTLDVYRINRL